MPTVHDTAARLLEHLGPASTMRLHRLCYYSQGWSLAWDDAPLFPEPIEAWAAGPGIPALLAARPGTFRASAWPEGDPDLLTPDQQETIAAVAAAYGHLTGRELSLKARLEPPWLQARAGLPPGARSRAPLDPRAMRDWFSSLDGA